MKRALLVVTLAGCKGIFGIDDPVFAPIDARSVEDADDAPPDTPGIDSLFCYGTVEPICFETPPTGAISISVATQINTSDDSSCTMVLAVPASAARCVIAADTITIASNATYTAIGSRPLLLLAATSIRIDGRIDAASKRGSGLAQAVIGAGANAASCSNANAVSNRSGGAGGSFRTAGGEGGRGGQQTTPSQAATTETLLRGGCRGGNGEGSPGEGGSGGGALLLVSPMIDVSGSINASGAAGRSGGTTISDGGGGGGSGGAIILDAMTVTITGVVLAIGGGGGEGSGNSMRGVDGQEASVTAPNNIPQGGTSNAGGDGGDAARDAVNAGAGNEAPGAGTAGGGGGGGVGLVRIVAPSQTVTGVVHPPAVP